jgi:signal transduction histidine kinase
MEGDNIAISVEDRGPGIPADQRERVVERFVRLDQSRSTPGNGLGLSLVAGVMKLHNGQLTFEDNAPGLRVKLVLPPYTGER